jgi:hypothetical protein
MGLFLAKASGNGVVYSAAWAEALPTQAPQYRWKTQ